MKRDGFDGEVEGALKAIRQSLLPISHNRLVDRLTALGMMMAPNRPPAEASIWLREMARLLADMPEDILGDAIDRALIGSKFIPTLAEIRERADPNLEQRRRVAARLEAIQRLIESGANVPPAPRMESHPQPKHDFVPCSAEQAAEIMAEFGLRRNPLDYAREKAK